MIENKLLFYIIPLFLGFLIVQQILLLKRIKRQEVTKQQLISQEIVLEKNKKNLNNSGNFHKKDIQEKLLKIKIDLVNIHFTLREICTL